MPAKSWSSEEEQQLLQLLRETSLTQREIAQKLGRTEAAVSARLTIARKRGVDGAAPPRSRTPDNQSPT
ncbi:HTH domain-containing protein (plasmid) [Bradyrhizobium sp. LCT2]|nr:HTH domain-containing protein [Bradyrhizobium sp. LCT2]